MLHACGLCLLMVLRLPNMGVPIKQETVQLKSGVLNPGKGVGLPSAFIEVGRDEGKCGMEEQGRKNGTQQTTCSSLLLTTYGFMHEF